MAAYTKLLLILCSKVEGEVGMKINIVIPSTVLGGGVRVLFLYSNYLVQNGHDVVIYVPMLAYSNQRGKPNIKTSIANTFKRRTVVNWFDCQFKIKLAPAIKDIFIRDADITIASAWYTAPDVFDLSASKGKKIYFIQDYEIWNQNKEIVDATYKLDMNRIVITKSLQKLLNKNFGVDSTVIYNGHHNDEYLDEEKVINNRKCIIMLCNTANYKGGWSGIEILKKLYKKYGVRIILFGVTKPSGIPEYFEFYVQPQRAKLMSLYEQADICLFPSLKEAWGLTAIEAMANRCAVVGNNTGCLSELCSDRKEASIVYDFDFQKLELKVEELINDEVLLKEIQDNGYQLAKSLSWDISFKKFENYLKNCKD